MLDLALGRSALGRTHHFLQQPASLTLKATPAVPADERAAVEPQRDAHFVGSPTATAQSSTATSSATPRRIGNSRQAEPGRFPARSSSTSRSCVPVARTSIDLGLTTAGGHR